VPDEKRIEITYISVDDLVPMEENPNFQSDAVFNNLVDNISKIGMVEPIMVAPLRDEDGAIIEGKYKIVSGEHRYFACKMLDYEEVPTIVQMDFDDDAARFQLVRMNMLKGKLDPVKFTKLYNQMAEKYGEELTKELMGLVEEAAFKNLYLQVKKELSPEMQEKLEESKDDIKTVDDLSRVLNEMFSKYGDTLHQHFMVFQYGGKTHLWVQMSKDLKKRMIDQYVEKLKAGNFDMNEFFDKLILQYGDAVMETMEPIAVDEDEGIFVDSEGVL